MDENLLNDLADLAKKYSVQLFGNVQTSEGTEAFTVGDPQGNVTVKEIDIVAKDKELEALKKALIDNNIAVPESEI